MHESAPLLAAIQSWASTRPDIVGLLFVGSHGRGTPGPYSEVAVVVLTTDPARYRSDKQWHAKIAWPRGAEAEGPTCEVEYGRTWSRHVALTDLRLVQFTFALPSWADTAPIDPGTYLVVGTVRQILWDPEGRLARLSAALEPGVVDDPAAAKEFMRSWEGAEESYSQWAVPTRFHWLAPMRGLVQELRHRGYARLFRCGYSAYRLLLSRSMEHGLRGDQPYVLIWPREGGGLQIEHQLRAPGGVQNKSFTLATVSLTRELGEILQRLAQEKID